MDKKSTVIYEEYRRIRTMQKLLLKLSKNTLCCILTFIQLKFKVGNLVQSKAWHKDEAKS